MAWEMRSMFAYLRACCILEHVLSSKQPALFSWREAFSTVGEASWILIHLRARKTGLSPNGASLLISLVLTLPKRVIVKLRRKKLLLHSLCQACIIRVIEVMRSYSNREAIFLHQYLLASSPSDQLTRRPTPFPVRHQYCYNYHYCTRLSR